LNVSDNTKDVTFLLGAINYDEKDILFPNEDTDYNKIKGYKEIFDKYKIQINPVLTFYKDGPSMRSLIKSTMIGVPPKIQVYVNGTQYKLWAIKNPIDLEHIKKGLRDISRVYIADGHHRFSIFQELSKKVSAKIMISLTDSDTICLKSCHRVIIGPIKPNWQQEITKYCVLELLQTSSPTNGVIMKLKNGETYRILLKPEVLATVSIYYAVDNMILQESLGVTNKSDHIYPLPGSICFSDSDKVFDLYTESSAIIFIPNLNISEFFKIVDNGNKLPPTSTWFEPKIVDGFAIMNFG
jgi:uncharacterized protein (DUF1015 family)